MNLSVPLPLISGKEDTPNISATSRDAAPQIEPSRPVEQTVRANIDPPQALDAAPSLTDSASKPKTSATSELSAAVPQKDQGPASSPSDQARLAATFDGLNYPRARRDKSVVDDYFGTKIADPYRWLENPNSKRTKAWVAAQNRLTEKFLASLPERNAIAKRIKQLERYETFSEPEKIGDRWFFYHNNGIQEHAVFCTTQRNGGKRKVLINPNRFSRDGSISLAGASLSRDGRYVAYGISRAGSDWVTWKVRDVATGKNLPGTIKWTKVDDVTWAKNGKGFYYVRFPRPRRGQELTDTNKNPKIYYHALGTSQKDDILIYGQPDHPTWSFDVDLTDDGRFLLLYQQDGVQSKNRIWVKELSKRGSAFKPLFDAFDAQYQFVGNDGERFYIQTNKDAARGKFIAVDFKQPSEENWKTIIPQSEGRAVLDDITRVGDRFVAIWNEDAHSLIKVYGLNGDFQYEVKLPGLGTVSSLWPRTLGEKKFALFTFESFTHPPTDFQLNLETGQYKAFRRPKVPVNTSQFEVKQAFYPSKDGAQIPMFIVHKKGLKLDGKNPTYLYAYGAYGDPAMPEYGSDIVAWLERGGVYAVAGVRGGGEYGDQWHDAGRLHNKQNSIDDFIAAAEYLIKDKYTSTANLAIGGSSAGGLLVAAAMTQRPDLFAAAIPEVGLTDMLRYHLFTIGYDWIPEFGSSQTKEGLDTLIKYSPLHNVKPGTRYPATLILTGERDDRVVPAHSEKFTAALQAAHKGSAPILIRIERKSGHEDDSTDAEAARWAFLLHVLGASKK